MMTEAEPPAPSRLRRRSFFEAPEPSAEGAQQLDAVSLDLAAATAISSSNSSTSTSTSAVFPVVADAEGGPEEPAGGGAAAASTSSASSAPRRPLLWAAAARTRELLRRARAFLGVQLQVWRLLLLARCPPLVRGWLLGRGGRGGLGGPGGDPAGSPVKHWAYPTHWLAVASATLVLAQLATYWRFQTLPMDLRVDECAFRERLLASSYDAAPLGALGGGGGNSQALRVLERRFEQQYSAQALAQRSRQRLPWTCMAVVPTSSGRAAADELALARQLAFFWPRAEVVDPRAPVQRASRLQVVLGAAPRAARSGGEHAGVVAALLPLEAFRRDLFARRFPDLVLVKTEFALRQMLRFREERAEERAVGQDAPRADADAAEAEDDALSWSQFGVYLLKATVPDVYDRRERKDWDAFLHVVVRSEQDKQEQFTEELLALWLAHPRWPTLRVRFASSLALCSSFQLLLSSLAAQQAAAAGGEDEDEDGGAAAPDRWAGDGNNGDDDIIDAVDDYDWAALDARLALGDKKPQQPQPKPRKTPPEPNIELVCDAEANSPQEIARLKNAVGMHVFPVPPEVEAYEELALESLAAGALVLTYDTPVMQEWVPDACGVRVGSFEVVAPTAAGELLPSGERVALAPGDAATDALDALDGRDASATDGHDTGDAAMDAAMNAATGTATGELRLPVVHVAPSDIEQGVERLLALDRANRVAAGRAARAQYLALRTHYLSALAALDVAVCDDDGEGVEGGELPSEIGARSRRKVEVETLRSFLY